MRTELCALRTVPRYRRALALAIAFSGFLAISFLGLKDLATTRSTDARSALSSGAITGLVVIVYAAATAGGEIARGGLALALIAQRTTAPGPSATALAAYAAAGAMLGLAGAIMAAAITFVLLGFGGARSRAPSDFLARARRHHPLRRADGRDGAALGPRVPLGRAAGDHGARRPAPRWSRCSPGSATPSRAGGRAARRARSPAAAHRRRAAGLGGRTRRCWPTRRCSARAATALTRRRDVP